MTRRKRKPSKAGRELAAMLGKPYGPGPAPVSGPELEYWHRTPNLRIRAGRAVQAVAQAMSMMYRQAQEAEARHQKALRDCQEQTAKDIAKWVVEAYQSCDQHTWASNTADHIATEILAGAWLPQAGDDVPQDESDLLTNGPRKPAYFLRRCRTSSRFLLALARGRG